MSDKPKITYSELIERYIILGQSESLAKFVGYNYKRLGIQIDPGDYLNEVLPYKNDLTSSLRRLTSRLNNPETPKYNLNYSLKNLSNRVKYNIKDSPNIPYDIYLNYIRSIDHFIPTKLQLGTFLGNTENSYGRVDNKYFKVVKYDYSKLKVNGGRLLDFFVKEYENDKVYIPSSGYCLKKTIIKYLSLNNISIHNNHNNYNFYLNPEASSLNEVLDNLDYPIIPPILFINDNSSFEEISLQNYKVDEYSTYRIVLISITKLYFHCILAKDFYNTNIYEYSLSSHITKYPKIEIESYRLTQPLITSSHNIVISYDIETYVVNNPERKDSRILYPFALSYSFVNLSYKTFTPPKIIEKTNIDSLYSSDVFDNFILSLYHDCYDGVEVKKKLTYQIFAHFGGRFDNLYVKTLKNPDIIFRTCLKKGNNIKYLKIQYKELTLIFKDSYNFTLSSLKKLSKCFNLVNKKDKKTDIVDKPQDWYLNNKNIWEPYLIKDVKCLSELLYTIEPMYKELGLSITLSSTLSGLSWRLLNKTCYGMKFLTVPKTPSLKDLYTKSLHGGRVIHWKKDFDEKVYNDVLINIDGNSLYPSALYSSSIPFDYPKLLETLSFDEINNYEHYIIDVLIQPSNTKYPLHPHKDKDGLLIYTVEIFRDVYNDVDIREMLKDGYKVLKVYRGIYFENGCRIYSDIVKNLYEKRQKYKKENNHYEFILKIFLNNLYGYHLEKHNEHIYYNKIENSLFYLNNTNKLPNGQTEYTYISMYNLIDKPIQIGGYVLSYARKIMNEYIRKIGPENIWYGDTDALYVLKSVLERKGIILNNEMCGVKNDYGMNMCIPKAIFLDRKKYILQVRDENHPETFYGKVKYSGIEFSSKYKISTTKLIKNEETFNQIFRDIYRPLNDGVSILQLYQRFRRLLDGVRIDATKIKYSLRDEEKCHWNNRISVPFGYNEELEEYKLKDEGFKHLFDMKKVKQLQYEKDIIGKKTIYKSKVPIISNDNDFYISYEHDKVESSFILLNDRIYYREIKNIRNKRKHLLYESNEYGPLSKNNLTIDDEKMVELEYGEIIGVPKHLTIMQKEDF
jgi:hypothetical protein